jgi:hypothetical protein
MKTAERALERIKETVSEYNGKIHVSYEGYTSPEGRFIRTEYSFHIDFPDDSTLYDSDIGDALDGQDVEIF